MRKRQLFMDVESICGSKIYSSSSGALMKSLMLDSCEDIHEHSLSIFKNLFENQIIIE